MNGEIMSTTASKSKRQKYNLGSIVAIPLPEGQFAFGKVYRDQMAIYDLVLDHIPEISKVLDKPILFFHDGTDDGIKKGLWPVIGEQPFVEPDDAWGPPKATCYNRAENRWTMFGLPRVNHKGEDWVATLEQVQGLEIMKISPTVESFVRSIVNRLIKGNHEEYKVRAS
jgi:hypothetical protein